MGETKYQDFLSGSLSGELVIGDDTMVSSALVAMIAVVPDDIMKVVLNPRGIGGVRPEVVYVTDHSVNATSAEVARGQDGTDPQNHPAGTIWFVAPLGSDWQEFRDRIDGFINSDDIVGKGDSFYGASATNVDVFPAGGNGKVAVYDSTQTLGVRAAYPVEHCTSSTRPTSKAYVGLHIFETDTLHTLVCSELGSPNKWVYVGDAPGDFKWSGNATTPEGYLLCDGSAVSRTTYAALFAAISTAYGAGNGTTTFNVPDLRERTLLATSRGYGGTARVTGGVASGQTGGVDKTALTSSHVPLHSHSTSTAGSHDHNDGNYPTLDLNAPQTVNEYTELANSSLHNHVPGYSPSSPTRPNPPTVALRNDGSSFGLFPHAAGDTNPPGVSLYQFERVQHDHRVALPNAGDHQHTVGSYGSSPVTAVPSLPPYAAGHLYIRI